MQYSSRCSPAKLCLHRINGVVVTWVVAIDPPGVRFPLNAIVFLFESAGRRYLKLSFWYPGPTEDSWFHSPPVDIRMENILFRNVSSNDLGRIAEIECECESSSLGSH